MNICSNDVSAKIFSEYRKRSQKSISSTFYRQHLEKKALGRLDIERKGKEMWKQPRHLGNSIGGILNEQSDSINFLKQIMTIWKRRMVNHKDKICI